MNLNYTPWKIKLSSSLSLRNPLSSPSSALHSSSPHFFSFLAPSTFHSLKAVTSQRPPAWPFAAQRSAEVTVLGLLEGRATKVPRRCASRCRQPRRSPPEVKGACRPVEISTAPPAASTCQASTPPPALKSLFAR